MMRKIFTLLLLFSVTYTFAQDKQKTVFKEDGNLTIATYYYDNGTIQQEGTFNAAGKLHGNWYSYDANGKKIVAAKYENGDKVGKWFFWTDDVLKEVDYSTNAIVSVVEWSNDKILVAKN